MGVSKVVLVDPNTQTPEILMDVTGDDTSADVLLAGNVGTRNDGEKVTGTIPEKTSSDLTVSGATVTAPAGHYASSASATVASGTAGTPTATKGSVSNHSVNVTPSVTNTSGYISGGTQTGTAVSVSAGELVSGTKSISANGTGIDVTNYAAVDVDVTSGVPGLEHSLCFSSPSSFTLAISESAAGWDGVIEWTDGTQPWAIWDGTSTLSASAGVLYLRGTGNEYITGSEGGSFVLTGTNISCVGNIETLLDYATVALGNHPTMGTGCYKYLFADCTNLISAPILPATTLTSDCYNSMFTGCTGLLTAPKLSATILADYCYCEMFNGCVSLTSAPALPATTLAQSCYEGMFTGCSGLISAPALPATTLIYGCYSYMFNGCTSLMFAPVLPATTLASYCYSYMFFNCPGLTTAPELPATTLQTSCYSNMFVGCTGLESLPVLPATTLKSNCYSTMFSGCTGIKLSTTYDSANYPYALRIPESGTGTTATNALLNMFAATGGSFKGTPTINTVYYLSKPLPVDFTIDGDATASDILSGKISYANGSRVVGNIASKTSSDLTASGATVTAPAGYYAAAASKAVASGTQGTPTISVGSDGLITASCTDTTGYITGTTKTATQQMTARTSSDLTFAENRTTGTPTVTAPAGYYDEDATKVISMGTITGPTITKGTVSNNTMPLTSSITMTAGYYYPATATTSGTSVSASELVSGTKSISANGTGIDVTNYASVDVAVPPTPLQTKSVTPTESAQTVTPDSGYALSEVDVGAISSTYVGSGIARKSSTDLTASGATVTAPAGYYSAAASKAVASGTAGTPTATKGTVSNHSISVTPSVTNATGYITGSTKTGTAVSVSASELVSGTKSILANGTGIDVTNYAAVNVAVPTGEGEYSWLGLYGELVDDALYSVSGTLSSTNFPSWTPSTSSTTMVNPQTAKARGISDMDDYEYVAVWEAKVDLTYNSGSVNKSKPLYTRSLLTQHIFRRPGTWNSIQSKTFDTNACAASEIVNFCYGYNHNSSLSYVWQYTTTYKYCCWLGGEDATFTSSTGNTVVTFKSPRIYVSCDSYYFSTTNAGYVNPASSTYSIKGKLFRIKRDGILRGGVGLVIDMIKGQGW